MILFVLKFPLLVGFPLKSVGSKYATGFFSSDEWWFTSVASVVAFTYFWDCFPWKEDWDQLCGAVAAATLLLRHHHHWKWFVLTTLYKVARGGRLRWEFTCRDELIIKKLIDKIPKWTYDVICLPSVILIGMSNVWNTNIFKIVHSKLIQLLFHVICFLGRGSLQLIFSLLVQGQINVVWMKKYSKQKKGVSKLDSSCEHFTRNVSEKSELPFKATLKWNGFIFFFSLSP